MGEPSKEAYELADKTLAAAIPEPHRTFIAAALQKLMDDRERAEDAAGRISESYLTMKAHRDEAIEMGDGQRQRAKSAEERVKKLESKREKLTDELFAARAKFAGLVRRILEWDADNDAPYERLFSILAEYGGAPSGVHSQGDKSGDPR